MFYPIDSLIGDQRSSYNQNIILRVNGLVVTGTATSRMQYFIIIAGADDRKYLRYSKISYNQEVIMDIRLHEDEYDLTLTDFMEILSNISTIGFCIKTEGSQTDNISIRFGAYFTLESAKQDIADDHDTTIKSCNCHLPYSGQFCELCAEGYFRVDDAGPFDPCIPLQSLSKKDSCRAFLQGNNPIISCTYC